jgi:hypothetical protein
MTPQESYHCHVTTDLGWRHFRPDLLGLEMKKSGQEAFYFSAWEREECPRTTTPLKNARIKN